MRRNLGSKARLKQGKGTRLSSTSRREQVMPMQSLRLINGCSLFGKGRLMLPLITFGDVSPFRMDSGSRRHMLNFGS